MSDLQVKQVISALLDATFLDDWFFYVILFSVSLLGGLAGAYLKSYGSEKAKYDAIESSLDTIKKQVKATTETSERIKHSLEINNWRKKELETLKRSKLEEYGNLLLAVFNNMERLTSNKLYDKEINFDEYTVEKLTLIQSLYLPEISSEHSEYAMAYFDLKAWIYEGATLKNAIKEKCDEKWEGHLAEGNGLFLNLDYPQRALLEKLAVVATNLNINHKKADS